MCVAPFNKETGNEEGMFYDCIKYQYFIFQSTVRRTTHNGICTKFVVPAHTSRSPCTTDRAPTD